MGDKLDTFFNAEVTSEGSSKVLEIFERASGQTFVKSEPQAIKPK